MKDYAYDQDATPFQPSFTGYHANNALCLACAANLAYLDEDEVKPVVEGWGFPEFKFFDLGETQAFVCGNAEAILIAFRGTEPGKLKDWLTDLKFRREEGVGGEVHRGFKGALDSVWPDVAAFVGDIRTTNQTLWFCGHSLGAALATLAAARFRVLEGLQIQGLYTFGHPRTGDSEFARNFDDERVYRFVNNNDVVTRVPTRKMGYSHVGRLVYLTNKGRMTNRMNLWQRLMDRVSGRIDDLGKLGTDGIKDHDMSRYVGIIRKNQHVALNW